MSDLQFATGSHTGAKPKRKKVARKPEDQFYDETIKDVQADLHDMKKELKDQKVVLKKQIIASTFNRDRQRINDLTQSVEKLSQHCIKLKN